VAETAAQAAANNIRIFRKITDPGSRPSRNGRLK
jgi:hypothetical protein